MKILYQGSEGAYSQLAALEVYPKMDTISCKTFEECFQKCTAIDMPVFLFTYYHCRIDEFPSVNPFYSFVNIL